MILRVFSQLNDSTILNCSCHTSQALKVKVTKRKGQKVCVYFHSLPYVLVSQKFSFNTICNIKDRKQQLGKALGSK